MGQTANSSRHIAGAIAIPLLQSLIPHGQDHEDDSPVSEELHCLSIVSVCPEHVLGKAIIAVSICDYFAWGFLKADFFPFPPSQLEWMISECTSKKQY